MNKTKVLLLLHELTLTGAPRVALEAFGALRDSTELRIVSLREGPMAEMASGVGPLEVLSDGWKLRGWRWHLHRRFHHRRWLRGIHRWSPDLIYVNSVVALPIATAVPLPEAPAILHVHELRSQTQWMMSEHPDLLARWPSRYIAVSEAVVRDLEATCGVDPSRVSLVHASIKDRDVAGAESAPAEGAPGGAFVVGGCGYPNWRKGELLWLQMAVELRRLMGDAVRFAWVGVPDNYDGRIFRLEARLLGLEGAVEFVPITPTPLAHFARFHVFAMTSLEDPCPLVVLENMLLGKPVVCFANSGGAPDQVGDPRLVVDGFSPREMARRIAELASSPEERTRLGEAARGRVRSRFTDRVQVPKIRRVLDDVLRGRPAPGGAPADGPRSSLVGTNPG